MSDSDKTEETKLARKLWDLGAQHSIDEENYWDYIAIWRSISSKDEEFGATFLLKIAMLIDAHTLKNTKTDDLSKGVKLEH
jgi:hypothetical protein